VRLDLYARARALVEAEDALRANLGEETPA
jgi:hypothetical protein